MFTIFEGESWFKLGLQYPLIQYLTLVVHLFRRLVYPIYFVNWCGSYSHYI